MFIYVISDICRLALIALLLGVLAGLVAGRVCGAAPAAVHVISFNI